MSAKQGTDMLAARYRRVLMVLPAAYRERRGEEMLSTLLDGAADGKRRPSLAEASSLAALAIRLRVGAPGASRRAVATGEVLRRTALAGLLAFGLWHGTGAVGNLVVIASERSQYFQNTPGSTVAWWLTLVFGLPLVYFGAFIALVLGRRRLGRFLGVAQAGFVAAASVQDRYPATSDMAAVFATSLMIALATGLGFHRGSPRPAAPGRWLSGMIGVAGVVFIVSGAAIGMHLDGHSGDTRVIDVIAQINAGPLVPGLAAVFGLVRARRSPIWPAALFILGLPGLLIVPRALIHYAQGNYENVFIGDLFRGAAWPGMAVYMLITEAVLATALVWSLYLRRARATAVPA
ncbi:hypothetical protein KGA66_11345 [Actinocrinis puniceicyclus]|uniref:Uncharacterized protein n=1 Tax=Actinocrinis puniceicyclus TaxID=977794 RepID=A0A8J7WJW3_9ACTN|nr:hypothetical protein [Actinocrinis puniceicyclus]MBS2963646.1 hypothetical protein [Actinocrinis puniceicyclus]